MVTTTGEGTELPGRKPPQALEAEAAVLAAALLDAEAVPKIIQYLRPEHFYSQTHRKVFEAILALFEKNQPCDIVTVAAELKRMGELEAVGGQPFLSSLLDSVLTTAHCEEYAKLVLEKAVQRQLIQTATEIVLMSYDESRTAQSLLDFAEQQIFQIREAGARREFSRIKELLRVEMEHIDRAMAERKLVTGVETGYHELDELTSGLQKGDLIIVAGRPAMGKTAFALNIAVNASAGHKIPVAIFSLEMSTESLVQRLMCSEAGISMHKLRKGMLSWEEHSRLAESLGPLFEAPLFIDDSAGLTALDIRARARRLKSEVPLGLVIVDYLQLMEAHGDRRRERNRQQEIAEITRALKGMARELGVPVLVVSQLSRAPETRGGDKRPQLSDLRESGAIEQDADVVLLLYRPGYYNQKDPTLRGKTELNIAKQRNGPTKTIELVFLEECMRFENPYTGGREEPPEEPGSELADTEL
ncbi:MAG: replicative DNA helicase [candidate division WOR-3 bacterium]